MNYDTCWRRLTTVYEADEAKAIVRLVLDLRFGLSWTDIVCGKVEELSADEQRELELMMQRLETGEPVQYVLGVAEFGPRQFHVEPGVLIPRPETYELCQWILTQTPAKWKGRILDIGTGSGCIACTLAAERPDAEVTAWDISDAALRIAAVNAKRAHVLVSFEKTDILQFEKAGSPQTGTADALQSGRDGRWDVVVSNPPYICEKEKKTMERNVLAHEPALALFVPDHDPLLFYRAIARYAVRSLRPEGRLFFEINPLYAEEMKQMLQETGFSHVETRKDMFDKQRFMCAWKPFIKI